MIVDKNDTMILTKRDSTNGSMIDCKINGVIDVLINDLICYNIIEGASNCCIYDMIDDTLYGSIDDLL